MMCFPFTVDNRVANNALMSADDRPYDLPRAFRQWMDLYRALSREALVYVLPSQANFRTSLSSPDRRCAPP